MTRRKNHLAALLLLRLLVTRPRTPRLQPSRRLSRSTRPRRRWACCTPAVSRTSDRRVFPDTFYPSQSGQNNNNNNNNNNWWYSVYYALPPRPSGGRRGPSASRLAALPSRMFMVFDGIGKDENKCVFVIVFSSTPVGRVSCEQVYRWGGVCQDRTKPLARSPTAVHQRFRSTGFTYFFPRHADFAVTYFPAALGRRTGL